MLFSINLSKYFAPRISYHFPKRSYLISGFSVSSWPLVLPEIGCINKPPFCENLFERVRERNHGDTWRGWWFMIVCLEVYRMLLKTNICPYLWGIFLFHLFRCEEPLWLQDWIILWLWTVCKYSLFIVSCLRMESSHLLQDPFTETFFWIYKQISAVPPFGFSEIFCDSSKTNN